MLIVKRRAGEGVAIGEDVTVIVAGARGSVKLAIDAPAEVPIRRVGRSASEAPHAPNSGGDSGGGS